MSSGKINIQGATFMYRRDPEAIDHLSQNEFIQSGARGYVRAMLQAEYGNAWRDSRKLYQLTIQYQENSGWTRTSVARFFMNSEEIPQYQKNKKRLKGSSADGVDPKYLKLISKTLKKVAKQLDDYFKLGAVEFYVGSGPSSPFRFDPAAGRMELPYFESVLSENSLATIVKVGWIHEYAHAYFDSALRQDWPLWKEMAQEVERVTHWQYYMSASQSSEECARFLGSKGLKQLYELVRPYDELFADTVAVILLHEGQAIARAMNFLGKFKMVSYRDFTIPHFIDQTIDSNEARSDQHLTLTPVRNVIWRLYEQNRAKLKSGEFLAKVYQVIKEELLAYASSPELLQLDREGNLNLDIAEMNDRLSDRLRKLDFSL